MNIYTVVRYIDTVCSKVHWYSSNVHWYSGMYIDTVVCTLIEWHVQWYNGIVNGYIDFVT
jgi:hypothetical protein